jgi:hypothetical protein
MERDIKDVIGVLMRILGGGDVSQEELDDLGFDADGELQAVLNEAYIKLREFAHDRPLRTKDRELDCKMRLDLQRCLDTIVSTCDRDQAATSRY